MLQFAALIEKVLFIMRPFFWGCALDIREIRRLNAIVLMHENALDPLGLASCLGLEEDSMLAMLQVDGKKTISEKIARIMEQTFSKPDRWMDGAPEQGASAINYDLFG